MRNRVVLLRFAGARYIVHVQTQRVADAMGEEGSADAGCEDRFLGVPRTRVRGLRGLEDTQFLEAAYERTVAKELDGIPVQSRLERLEGELEGQDVDVRLRK